MSDNKPAVIEPSTDLSDKDMRAVEKYVEAGLPGIAAVDGEKLAKIMDLYLSGKTYHQIAMVLNVPKPAVMYLSNKFNWFAVRNEYMMDLEASIRGRLLESRLVNQDFLLQIVQLFQKKIGNKITKYLATDDESHANSIDLKEIDKYLKTLDALHRLSADPKAAAGAATSPIGLNVGDGMSITKNEDGGIDITPKSKAIGDMLKQFADSRREEDKK